MCKTDAPLTLRNPVKSDPPVTYNIPVVTPECKTDAPLTLRNPVKSDPPVTYNIPVVTPVCKTDAPVTVRESSKKDPPVTYRAPIVAEFNAAFSILTLATNKSVTAKLAIVESPLTHKSPVEIPVFA